ncbi:hypothetical protein KV580_24400 [Pseudomonas chlororaphis]|nr:hypothetical protein [Pseudomonas chlororaphis]
MVNLEKGLSTDYVKSTGCRVFVASLGLGWDCAEKHAIGAFFVIRADTGFVTWTNQAFERLAKGDGHNM